MVCFNILALAMALLSLKALRGKVAFSISLSFCYRVDIQTYRTVLKVFNASRNATEPVLDIYCPVDAVLSSY